MRGRNRNKGPNPLTRTYESNGPDVKIRGTAQHVADKYAQLARDAQASGDPVAAENYLQHAEHYYRIIAAAQEQFRDQFGGAYQQRPFEEDGEEDGAAVNGHPYQGAGGSHGGNDGDPAMQPQPYETRAEGGERQQRFDRGDRQDRFGNRQRDRFRNDRQEFRGDNQRQDFNRGGPRREDEQPNGLPAFLTTPVRQPINVDEGENGPAPAEFGGEDAGGEPNGRYGRSRRRRRPRYESGGSDNGGPDAGPDLASEGAEPSGE
jgi:hypothetical protein